MMYYQVLGSPKSFSARFQASVNKFLQSGALEAVNDAVEKIFEDSAMQQVQNTEAKVSLFMNVEKSVRYVTVPPFQDYADCTSSINHFARFLII
jgi:hypothetical protein